MHIFRILSVIAMTFVLIGSVCAADLDANDVQIMSESNNDEIVNVENDLNALSENEEDSCSDLRSEPDPISNVNSANNNNYLSEGEIGNYSDLRSEIGSGGDKSLTKKEYRYTDGDGNTIEIDTPWCN